MNSFFTRRFFLFILTSILIISSVSAQDIMLEFCPVTKVQADKGFSSTINIRNNTSDVLDLANNKFEMDWPSLVSLPWPFSEGVQTGTTWAFKINLDWPGTLAASATAQTKVNNAKYSGVLQFPTSGTYTQDGKTYTVGVSHCAKTNPYELYDATVEFDRNCFIYSPTEDMCLGEAATEIWQGEGIFDAMIPTDRPSWAIAIMVAHRLFTNMAGVEMLSPNFWTATAMNESRMTCDPTIVPNQVNHWKINSGANTGTGIDTRTDNCFQVLNIGYTQIENNQPDLFAQTNAYGTAGFSNVIAGGAWETGALAVTYYHYQDIRYWNQIYCWNATKFHKDAKDPYAIEKVFYHAFHDGPNAGTQLINAINADYDNALNATNMHDVINTGGTWGNLGGGSSRKVANFTSLLDGGDGHLYNSAYEDPTQEYYGCYEEDIKWSDIEYYIDQVKILYPQLMDASIKSEIKAVFDGLASGGVVKFSNLGPVIDEIVIQMGGHDPSSYIATQYGASKTCPDNPIGVSLRTNDTICPGETGELQVWLAGDENYRVDIKYPDGSIHTFDEIDHSPYYIDVTQPGDYEVVYFEDDNEVGDINCNFAAITLESKNGSTIGWDKSSFDIGTGCASGNLIITKNAESTEAVTVSYTIDGVAQPDIVMGVNETEKVLNVNPAAGEYIITTISPNSCGTPINDTITFCDEDCTPPEMTILTPDTAICDGDIANVRVGFTGTADYDLYFKVNGLPMSVTDIADDFLVIPVGIAGAVTIDSLIDATCRNENIDEELTITVNPLPDFDLGDDVSVCLGEYPINLSGPAGMDTYTWNGVDGGDVYAVNDSGKVLLSVLLDGCEAKDSLYVSTDTLPIVDLGIDTLLCVGANGGSYLLDAGSPGSNYVWSNGENTQTVNVTSSDIYQVTVTDENGCVGEDEVQVDINTAPEVNLGDDVSICAGDHEFDATTAGATYEWHDGSTDPTFTGNSTNDEIWVIVTENSCSDTDTVALTVGGQLDIDLGDDVTICESEAPYELNIAAYDIISWEDDLGNVGNLQSFEVNATTEVRVEVEDATGCKGQDAINIIVNPNPDVDLGADTVKICNTSPAVDFDAGNPGATYAWSNGEASQVITKGNGEEGLYKVVVTMNGCSDSDSVYLKVDDELTVNLGEDLEICPGTQVTLDAGFGAGYTYDWNGAGPQNDKTFETGAGNVTVTVADAGGCSGTDDITITEVNPLVIDLGNDTSICAGDAAVDFGMLSGRVDVTVIGWQDASTDYTFTTDQAGVYTLEVDSAGCRATDDVELFVNALPVVDLGADTFICAGTNPVIELDGGVFTSYQWLDITNPIPVPLGVAQKQEVSNIGTYALIATDANGCINGDSLVVTEEQGTPVGFAGDTTTICPGGSHTVEVPVGLQGVGGASWEWQNDNSNGTDYTVENQNDGDFVRVILHYTNEFGCVSKDTNFVNVSNTLPVSLLDTAICEGEDVTFESGYPAAGYTFLWQDGSAGNNFAITDATLADAGQISVTINSDAGCSGDDAVNFTVNALPDPQLSANPICLGEDRVLDHGLVNVTSVWNTGENTNTIVATAEGRYSVTVTDANGCEDTVSVYLTVNNPPVVNLPDDQTLCEGEAYELGTGFDEALYSHQWSGANNATTSDISVTASGEYTVTVTEDVTNCYGSDVINFTFLAVPEVDLGNDTNLCETDEFVNLSSPSTDESYDYTWHDGSKGTGVIETTTGIYWLEVTNGNCSDVDSVVVTFYPNPISSLMEDTVLCFEDFENGLVLNAGRSGQFQWNTSPNDTNQTLIVDEPGTYIVDITNQAGCVTQDFVTIKEDCPASIWLPNSITADGNGLNDDWIIKGRGIEEVEVYVFNRWGELIWEGHAIGDSWDGTYDLTGNPVQQDVYVYKLRYTYRNVNGGREVKQRVGRVTVIR